MSCAACGHANPADSAFCEACGARLERSCASCGAPASRDARFCRKCGAPFEGAAPEAPRPAPPLRAERSPLAYTPRHLADKILTQRSALEGERKQVTVLFADVKGSMELAAQLGPDEWHTILDRFFEVLTEGVHRFEGTVNQYTGDGIMALFGAPIAHEDHAQRACFAALALRDALRDFARQLKRSHGFDFATRIGLNSGEVVVGKIGDDLRMDYTAQGHTVGLAQRMEALASSGGIYLSEHTAALASGYFALEDLGEFTLKGAAEPMHVFELQGLGGARSRFDLSRARGLVRFVGRDTEMRTLEAALERTRRGEGQVVGIVADAGTGKSRLCFEFAEHCRGLGLRVFQGHCVAHGKNVPLLPVLEVIRDYFGIDAIDDERTAREKVAGRLLLLDDTYRDVLPILFEFLGIPDSEHPAPPLPPEARQRRLFAVLRRLTQGGGATGQEAAVIWFEDLHWIDAASEAWLTEWVAATLGSRTVLLLNFRPEYHAAWMQRAHYQQLALAPLSAEAIQELLVDLIGSDPSTEGLARRIHAHTSGNPFFAEEVVQSLIESGQLEGARGAYRLVAPVERLEVPRTVQALLAARIDRLAEREKRVLQIASVIGKDWSEPLLAAVAGVAELELADALAALRAAEFVHEVSLYPVAEYTFKHPLTQEVALGSLLGERRRGLHAAVAKAIEARGGALEEESALLAHHWEQAGEALAAAGWHLRAALWMGARDVRESERHARAVVELLRKREESTEACAPLAQAAAWLMNLGWRIGLDEKEARSLFEDGRRWARAAGDLECEARLAGSYAAVICVAGRLEESLRVGEGDFAGLAERIGNPELGHVARAWMAYPRMIMGRFAEAEQRMLALIEAGEKQPDLGIGFLGVSLTGLVLQWLSSIRDLTQPRAEAEATFQRALRWLRGRGETEAECYLLAGHAQAACAYLGETEAALGLARQAAARAEELGAPIARSVSGRALAACLNASGEPAAALELARQVLAESRKHRVDLESEPSSLALLSAALLASGDVAAACDAARESVACAERIQSGMNLPDALHALTRALLAAGRLDEAEAAIERMEQSARSIGALNLLPLATWRRAELAELRGDAPEHARLLAEARAGFLARGAEGHARTLERLLAAATRAPG